MSTPLAFEARKAPGGAYHHNIFHQSEHLLCILREASSAPEIILWPYEILPWTRTLAGVLLPNTRMVSTCCGREKVAAKWFTGKRRVCGCWQRVCPLVYPAFWPESAGRAAQARIRETVRARCGLAAPKRNTAIVRLLLRPSGSARQLENSEEILRMLKSIEGVGDVQVATSDADRLLKNNKNSSDLPFLCGQVGWYAHADVVVSIHGSQATNAIFADRHSTVIDLQPFAYKPEAAAPSDYYQALLTNTDIHYRTLQSAKPFASPRYKGDPGGLIKDHLNYTSGRCREEKRCRLAYRDGGNIRLDEAGVQRLQQLVRAAIVQRVA